MIKYCVNCKHLKSGEFCSSPHLGKDVVTGEQKINNASAERRTRIDENGCGWAAKHFEMKSKDRWWGIFCR